MKDAICFLCENLYDSIEEAEVCERSHEAETVTAPPERERERLDDDGRDYSDPGDYLRGYED
jgi:hypothetical protein